MQGKTKRLFVSFHRIHLVVFSTVFSQIITRVGITTNWTIIPGIAVTTDSIQNIVKLNFDVSNPTQSSRAIPQTRRPASIVKINEIKTKTFLFGKLRYKNPDINPYTASSKAIETPIGKNMGWPTVRERKIGTIKPTTTPADGPHINPHKIIGICIGHNALPIRGILPIKNGRR